jgi:hypothetical protein
VFIVGRDRAAVARLADLLATHHRLGTVPPTGLLADLAGVAERNRDRLAGYGWPEQYWFTSLAAFVDRMQRDHVGRHGRRRWIDCPAWGRPSLAVIDRLFPRAQIVHVTGSGRWPRPGARAAATFGPGRYLEISADDLDVDPTGCRRCVLWFLGEEFDRFPVTGPDPVLSPAA